MHRRTSGSCPFEVLKLVISNMNPLRTCLLVAYLAVAVFATPSPSHRQRGNFVGSSRNSSLKPSEWLTSSELEALPSVNEVSLERLENMPLEEGANLINKLYHLSQINHDWEPKFVPSPSNIPVKIVRPNGDDINVNLNTLPQTVEELSKQTNFDDDEITIFITGLPEQSEAVTKANQKLVQAYIQRYSQRKQEQENKSQRRSENFSDKKHHQSSSEEDDDWSSVKPYNGNLVVIDLGASLSSFQRFALLDVERTGAMIGQVLAKITSNSDIPEEVIHIVAQGIASHVAGAAARQYTRLTGHKLRRITALDPSKVFAKNSNTLTTLSRGDADFVDAIHTSAHGMGTTRRVGDVDFFPNGPSAGVPGADNVVEAAMRATRYFAESVRPGNEINFPAVPASSFKQYRNKNGFGKRAYMGIGTDYDLKGDYMLEVNAQRPFGRRTPAQKQNTYHGVHQSLRAINAMDNE